MLYIGDVGSDEYEEINVARGGENFGWPCYEGPNDNINEEFAAQCPGPHDGAGITPPLWYYAHLNPGPGNAVIGGTFYNGSNYGPLNGSYFFADNPFGVMWTLKTDGNDNLVSAPAGRDDWFVGPPNTGYPPDGGLGLPVAIHTAPNGNIQYADLDQSDIYELQGCGANCPPVAAATVARRRARRAPASTSTAASPTRRRAAGSATTGTSATAGARRERSSTTPRPACPGRTGRPRSRSRPPTG